VFSAGQQDNITTIYILFNTIENPIATTIITMRQTSTTLEVPIPITYTPTTHRISKAKKGKRVHACQYPGCDKVFTRAEHRRYAFLSTVQLSMTY
jgi:hypothetical protein